MSKIPETIKTISRMKFIDYTGQGGEPVVSEIEITYKRVHLKRDIVFKKRKDSGEPK